MRQIVSAQGGDPAVVDAPDRLALGQHRTTVRAVREGYVTKLDALELGYASMGLGAGRSRSEDAVDWGAGIRLHVQRGDRVGKGDALATLYTSRRALLGPGASRTTSAIRIGARRPSRQDRIIATIRR
jgi:thymidine phosphorylase